MSMTAVVFGLLACLPATLAHGRMEDMGVDGVWAPNPEEYRWSPFNNHDFVPHDSMKSNDIICGADSAPGPKSVKVPAGARVDLRWLWTAKDRSHPGPIITYLADCKGSCQEAKKTDLEFFKIHERGWLGPPTDALNRDNHWAALELLDKNSIWDVKIPSDIAPGQYVLRNEIIAIQFDEKQFYPQCLNIEITGSGTAHPAGVRGPDLYNPTDPGLLKTLDVWRPLTGYPIPGPPLYQGGGSSSNTAPSSTDAQPSANSSAVSKTPSGTPTASAGASDANGKSEPQTNPAQLSNDQPAPQQDSKPEQQATDAKAEPEVKEGAQPQGSEPTEEYASEEAKPQQDSKPEQKATEDKAEPEVKEEAQPQGAEPKDEYASEEAKPQQDSKPGEPATEGKEEAQSQEAEPTEEAQPKEESTPITEEAGSDSKEEAAPAQEVPDNRGGFRRPAFPMERKDCNKGEHRSGDRKLRMARRHLAQVI